MGITERFRSTGLRWLWLTVLIIAFDQWTKILAEGALQLHEPVPVAPLLNFMLAYNTGAAFSFLADAAGWQRWFFAALALGVSGLILVWLAREPAHQRWQSIALSLVLGGALGNLWDRLTNPSGAVVDFIDVYYRDWHWPAFNIADSAITVGAVMLVIAALRGNRDTAG